MRESLALIVVLAIVGLFVLGMRPEVAAPDGSAQVAANTLALGALQAAQAQQAAQLAAQAAAASQASANQMLTIVWVVLGLPVLVLAVIGGLTCLTVARRWLRRWAWRMAANADDELPRPRPQRRRVAQPVDTPPPTRAVQVIESAPPPQVVNVGTPVLPPSGWGWDAEHHRDAGHPWNTDKD